MFFTRGHFTSTTANTSRSIAAYCCGFIVAGWAASTALCTSASFNPSNIAQCVKWLT